LFRGTSYFYTETDLNYNKIGQNGSRYCYH